MFDRSTSSVPPHPATRPLLPIALALIAALAGSVALLQSASAQPPLRGQRGDLQQRRSSINLQTVYLAEPIGRIHRVQLEGEPGGKGEMQLDPNRCQTNGFGDPTACTRIAAIPVAVDIVRLRTGDPSGQGRSLYEINGRFPDEKLRFHLVSPGKGDGAWRLLVDDGSGQRRAITLESRDGGKPDPGPGRPPQKGRLVTKVTDVELSISRKPPLNLTIKATGQVPTGGWSNPRLVKRVYIQPPADGIWEYEFHADPPRGFATQVISQVQATAEWKDFPVGSVKGIRVIGADGSSHEARLGRRRR